MSQHFLILYRDLDNVCQVHALLEGGLHFSVGTLDDWDPTQHFKDWAYDVTKPQRMFCCIYTTSLYSTIHPLDTTISFAAHVAHLFPAWKLFNNPPDDVDHRAIFKSLRDHALVIQNNRTT
jgi:hypothetical protein